MSGSQSTSHAARLRALALLAACAVILGACGGDDKPAPPAKPVQLSLEAPDDGAEVMGASVTVSGTVAPASAVVRVGGQRATVAGGRFRASVALELGTNVIDVMASAQGRSPAFTALRVARRATVRVPDVEGDSADEARTQLADAGLRARVERKGGLVERIVPGEATVCDTDPAAGETVARGSTVTVHVAKLC